MKKSIVYGMIGGMMVLGYMKYKDGSMQRAIKNVRPMIESAINKIKI